MEKILSIRDTLGYVRYYYVGNVIIAHTSAICYEVKTDPVNTGIYSILCDIERIISEDGNSLKGIEICNDDYIDCFMEEIEYFPTIKKELLKKAIEK